MIALIFNPAKNVKKFHYAEMLLNKAGIKYKIYQTSSKSDIGLQTQKALSDKAELIVSCGGDGTLLWVINSMVGSKVPIAILPIGCSNDYAKQLGIKSIDDAVAAIKNKNFIDVDLGECAFINEQNEPQNLYFNSTAGVGILAEIYALECYRWVERLKAIFKDLVWPFLCIFALLKIKVQKCKANVDHNKIDAEIPLVEITKTAQNGGFTFLSSASPLSGDLHAWHIKGSSKFTFIKILLQVIFSRLVIDDKRVFKSQCKSFTIAPEDSYRVHLNGDLVGVTPATFQFSSHKIPIAALK